MEATPYLLLVVLHISVLSEGNNSPPSPCSLPKEIGPCRFIEPCKPKLSSWNESFIIVSWEGLFEGCHENQINQMYVKTEEGKEVGFKKITFSKNEIYLEKKYCENSRIALRIDFNEDRVNFPNGQQRDLHTHYNNCTNIISTKNNDDIILGSSISAGILLVIILIILVVVIVLKKRCCKLGKKRNVDNDMDVDMNPVYGDYYYKDGGRRQNVVEVAKLIFF